MSVLRHPRAPAGPPGGPPVVEKGRSLPGAASFGLLLFLLSLGVLFAAALVAYLVVRVRADAWTPPGAPPLPGMLWVGTAFLLLTSGALVRAVGAARQGRQPALRRWLTASLALALLFLGAQALAWRELLAQRITADGSLYGYTFYVLTGLHALHVVGGLVPLVVVLVRAAHGAYDRLRTGGVRRCALYWHFLDGVWLVMFAALLLGA